MNSTLKTIMLTLSTVFIVIAIFAVLLSLQTQIDNLYDSIGDLEKSYEMCGFVHDAH